MSGQLRTARAVAELLDVSPETILRWTRRRELPAFKLPGGAIRYREDEIEKWLAERATPQRGVLTATPGAARAGTVPSTALTVIINEED